MTSDDGKDRLRTSDVHRHLIDLGVVETLEFPQSGDVLRRDTVYKGGRPSERGSATNYRTKPKLTS